MAKYSLESNIFLGMSHSGSVDIDAEGSVELSDTEVQQLVKLIRDNDGKTNVEKLNLEETYPEIYEKLREACYHMAYQAERSHWLWEGYESGYFDYDPWELMEYCEENCGFEFVPEDPEEEEEDEDEKYDQFQEWLNDYLYDLGDDEACDFMELHMNAELDLTDLDYEVIIPDAIIEMAKGK